MKDQPEGDDKISDSYREILPSYNSKNKFLSRNGFNQLRNDMGFTQIRFYYFKKIVGRVLLIMTNRNAEGENAVRFFTDSDSDVRPRACNSFTRLPDDNSTLAQKCEKWGYFALNSWGHSRYSNEKRLYQRPLFWKRTNNESYFYRCIGSDGPYQCDDETAAMSLGDTWQIYVR